MKQIIIRSQEEFDNITEVKADEEVITECDLKLNCKLQVFGKLLIKFKLDCSWCERYVVARESSSVESRESSRVVAWGSSSVVALGSSSVVAWGSSSVVARGSSRVVARESSSVEARESSSVEARGSSSVEARESSSVEARESSRVEAWESSSVVAWGSSSVVARGNSFVRAFSASLNLIMHGFSILSIASSLNLKFKKDKNVLVQKFVNEKYLDREGVTVSRGSVVLFKKVSSDWKTQEKKKNETLWPIGKTITHPDWNPTQEECGEGKFHACSRPYFCDEFRSEKGDRYIAIKIKVTDLHEWENGDYPHKIAFRAGKVLYECDRFGNKIENK